jgi:type I restriction enzyme S subunit
VSDLPSGWEWTTTRELFTFVTSGSRGWARYYSAEGAPFFRVGNLQRGSINPDLTDLQRVNPPEGSEGSRTRIQTNDILISITADLGRAALMSEVRENSYINQHVALARPVKEINSRYLAWYLSSDVVQRQWIKQQRGATKLGLGLDDIRSIAVPLPLRPEQDAIAAAIEEQFSRLDAGTSALSRARANINRLKSTVLSLVSEGTSSWIALGDIADVVGGVTKDTKKQNNPALVGVPYLRVANVQRGYLDLSQVATIRVPSATARKLRLESGDILFNEGGDRDKLGRGWVWEGQIPDCIHQNHVFRARLLDGSYEPKFISMHGNSFGRAWFDKNGKQTTNLASLSLTTLKSFPVPKIPIEAQREIVAEIERRLSILSAIEEETYVALRRAASLRTSVLESAFSGKLI